MISEQEYSEFVSEFADPTFEDHYLKLRLIRAATGLQVEYNEYLEKSCDEISELGDILFWFTDYKEVITSFALMGWSDNLPNLDLKYVLDPATLLDWSEKFTRSSKIRSKAKKKEDFAKILNFMEMFIFWIQSECNRFNITLDELRQSNYEKLTVRHGE